MPNIKIASNLCVKNRFDKQTKFTAEDGEDAEKQMDKPTTMLINFKIFQSEFIGPDENFKVVAQ